MLERKERKRQQKNYCASNTQHLREWITTDCRNTPSTTNPGEEETVDVPGNDGNASMPEQVKRPKPWGKMLMMMMMISL